LRKQNPQKPLQRERIAFEKSIPYTRTSIKANQTPKPTLSRSQNQVAVIHRPGFVVLDPPPMVEPMRVNTPLVFDMTQPPQLISIGEAFDPFRTMFQSSHPRVSVTELKFHCSRYFGTWALGRYWIPACLETPHTFLSTLCLASAHHDVIYGKPIESLETTALRQDIMHMVGENFLNPEKSVQDHNIIAVSQLIISDIILRKRMDLAWHEAGIEKMIVQRGGLAVLGVNGLLASSVSWIHLTSAVLREAKPRPMYVKFCRDNSAFTYNPNATVPESPIYSPRESFFTLQRSRKCNAKTLELLTDIHTMIDLLLQKTSGNSNILMNLYTKITSEYSSVSTLREHNVLTEADWKYEAVRLTAIINATAIINRSSLSEALTFTARKPPRVCTSSVASRSNESVFSTVENQQSTPMTDYSTSPSLSISSNSHFPFDASILSHTIAQSSPEAQRPSFSSTRSGSSSVLFFTPAPAAAPSRSIMLLKEVKDALEMSNLSDCWGDMGGVLLWIGLVMGAASHKCESDTLARYYSATAMRAGIMLCFDHTTAMHAITLRMTEVMEALSSPVDAEPSRLPSSSLRKRRRT
jgi:hypothetical protein